MHAALHDLMQAFEVSGMAVGTIAAGAVEQIHLLGQIDGHPVRSDTRWRVASLTKPLFVYAVLQLVSAGVIDLDRPLQDYLTTPYLDGVPLLDRITARHTMMHTSGLPNWRSASGLRVQSEPGARFSYSSEGLTYLQHTVEQVTGLSMRALLHSQVFTPLGMTASELAIESPDELPPMLHFLSGSLLANGALSLRTTLDDYLRFMLTVCSGAHDAMFSDRVSVGNVAGLSWGLGWGMQTTAAGLSCWHWGARGIPKTMNFALAWPAARRGIVIFTNHAHGLALCRDLIAAWSGEAALPAFDWLLPAHQWRPDGKAEASP